MTKKERKKEVREHEKASFSVKGKEGLVGKAWVENPLREDAPGDFAQTEKATLENYVTW